MRILFAVVCLLALGVGLAAQSSRRDPLNPIEIDLLRDTTQDPEKRLKHIVRFGHLRMSDIELALSAPPGKEDRGRKVHDLLEDFDAIAEMLDDNVDMYARQRADLRKPLKDVIQAFVDWEAKLKAMQQNAEPPSEEYRQYSFVLQSARETVEEGTANAKEVKEKQARAVEATKRKK